MTDADRPSTDLDWRHSSILCAVVFTLALVARASTWRDVFLPEGVVFTSPDSYAHMWRIWNAASESIPLAARDPYINFPHGGEVLWSPAFDWVLAVVVRAAGLGPVAAEAFGACVPALLGALSASLAALVATRAFSTTAGWVTGLLVAFLPGSVAYTRIGFLDHHAAVAVIGTLMLGGAMAIVARADHGGWVWPVATGGLTAVALSVWAGALLHVAVLQAALLLWVLCSDSVDSARARALRLACAHATAAAAILPLSLRTWENFGDFSPLALTRFQPTYLFAGAVCILTAAGLWKIRRLGTSLIGRFVSLAAIGATGLVITFLAIPDLGTTLGYSADWFSGDIEFLANIGELEPLIDFDESEPWSRAFRNLSPLFIAFPFGFAAIAASCVRSRALDRALLLFWTAAFCILTLTQSRFINTFSIAYAIVLGGAFSVAIDAIERKRKGKRSGTWVPATVGILLVGFIALWSFTSQQTAGGHSDSYEVRRAARREVARWLARERPVELDASGIPQAGLLCAWDAGHDFRYYARWPVHQDPFGPYASPVNVRLADRYFAATDEDEALAILRKLKTRFVAVDSLGTGRPTYPVQSMTGRLVAMAGSGFTMTTSADGSSTWIPALTRHRITFAAADGQMGEWLYEVVPGAVVVGSARPDSEVRADLKFYDPLGTPRVWKSRTRADEKGRFRLRLPYSTVGRREDPAVEILGSYTLDRDGESMSFDVEEAAVQSGSIVYLKDGAG